MSGNNAVPGRSVTSKTVTILDAFAGNRTELSLSDITRATDLPSSTVHRLVQELVSWGGLERTPRGHYAVGLRLWEIGARSDTSYSLRDAAMPYLRELFDVTRQHVQLAVMDGNDALLIEKLTAPAAISTFGRPGGRLPLHASAIGKALLAAANADHSERVLAAPLPQYTDYTITDTRDLRTELANVRREGFAVSRQELSIGVDSCAVAIAGVSGSRLAAISVVLPSTRGTLREIAHTVADTARAISSAVNIDRPRLAMSLG